MFSKPQKRQFYERFLRLKINSRFESEIIKERASLYVE